MCKKPNDIGIRDGAGTEKNVTDSVQREQIRCGAQYTDYKHLHTPLHRNSILRTEFPSDVDICIIGGGAIGSSIAYFLKEKAKHELNIVVVEKDKTVSMKFFPDKKRNKMAISCTIICSTPKHRLHCLWAVSDNNFL